MQKYLQPVSFLSSFKNFFVLLQIYKFIQIFYFIKLKAQFSFTHKFSEIYGFLL